MVTLIPQLLKGAFLTNSNLLKHTKLIMCEIINQLSRQVFFVRGKCQTLPSDLSTQKIHGSVKFKAREKFIKQHF